MYTGTRGSTQGDRKDNSPAPKATQNDIFSIQAPGEVPS
jgi:hypothetical protein